ncbi:cation-transporting P-type ATPase [Streptomyces cyaneofuscatus]|uniref:cation-transporting P-type ATPase n=1 Tax=Streptomyces cyaneofuscatus TaxID=66883 RepID=UPI0036601420
MADSLAVVPALGLTTGDAVRRADARGANELAEPVRRPQWLRLLDKFGSWLPRVGRSRVGGSPDICGLSTVTLRAHTRCTSSRRAPLTCYFLRWAQAGVFSMTHHVECVAILEPAAKGA